MIWRIDSREWRCESPVPLSLTRTFLCWNCRGLSCRSPLATPNSCMYPPPPGTLQKRDEQISPQTENLSFSGLTQLWPPPPSSTQKRDPFTCLAIGAYVSWFLSPKRIMQSHVKSWQIMQNHAPEMRESARKCFLRMPESAWKGLMPRKPKNQETQICFQWTCAPRTGLYSPCGPTIHYEFVCCLWEETPKGPSRTKNTAESKFSTETRFAAAMAKRYGEVSECLSF